jgi:hypothetical protein
MHYIIYRTTNKINGKYYIGAHRTENLNDGYVGSGVGLKRAIAKYGKENFITETLHTLPTENEMYEKEKELVSIGKNTYNMTKGGYGGWSHVNSDPDRVNPMHCEENVEKMNQTKRVRGSYNTEAAKKSQLANLAIAHENQKGKERPEHAAWMRENSNLKKMMTEDYDGWRASLGSLTYELTRPDGVVIVSNRVKDVCKEYGIGHVPIYRSINTGKPVLKGTAKGWKARKI